jgi:hypothetical protein
MISHRLTLALVLAALAAPASAQFALTAADGKSSLKFGVLAQVQGESLDNASATAQSRNLFVRRARLLVGGKLGERVSVFLETDSPNLGKAGTDGKKNEGSLYLQDLIVTCSLHKTLKVDAGLLLMPLAHHAGQAATTLLATDYGPYAFASSSATQSRVGRDYGVDARAYLASQHVELRGAVLQGWRGVDASAPFRTFARAAVHVLEPETDFFYTGTTLGQRRILSFGASYDGQKDYKTIGADAFFDHPMLGKNAVTLQADYWHVDGGTFLTDLPRQDVWFVEGGAFVARLKVTPFFQFSHRDYDDARRADESAYQAGVAYWAQGHKLNVKVGAGQIKAHGAPERLQVLGQLQLLLW